jgi:hypothetical protein
VSVVHGIGIEDVYGEMFFGALQQNSISHMIHIKIHVQNYMKPYLFIVITSSLHTDTVCILIHCEVKTKLNVPPHVNMNHISIIYWYCLAWIILDLYSDEMMSLSMYLAGSQKVMHCTSISSFLYVCLFLFFFRQKCKVGSNHSLFDIVISIQ